MKRRDFLKAAGVGSLGLASLSGVPLGSLRGATRKPEQRHSTFVAASQAPAIGMVLPRALMEGLVEFSPDKGKVRGGGSFTVIDWNAPVPKPFLKLDGEALFGIWEAAEFGNYTAGFGTYGRIEASILDLLIDLELDGGETIEDVALRVVCNIGPAGIFTGQPEGFELTIPGTPFGTFKALDPPVGLMHISIPDND